MINNNWALKRYSYGAGKVLLPLSYSSEHPRSNGFIGAVCFAVLFSICLWGALAYSPAKYSRQPVVEEASSPVRLQILSKEPEISIVETKSGKSKQTVVEVENKGEIEKTKPKPEKTSSKPEEAAPKNKAEPAVKPEVQIAEKMKQQKTEIQETDETKERAAGAKPMNNSEERSQVAATSLPDLKDDEDTGPYTGRLQSMDGWEKPSQSGDNERADILSGNANLPKEEPVTGSLAAGMLPRTYYSKASEQSLVSRRADGENDTQPALKKTMNPELQGMPVRSKASESTASRIGVSEIGASGVTGPINGYRKMGAASPGKGIRPASVRSKGVTAEVSGIGSANAGAGDGGELDKGSLSRSVTPGTGNEKNASGEGIGYSGVMPQTEPSDIIAGTGTRGEISYGELAICEDVSREAMLKDEIFNIVYENPELSRFRTDVGIVVFFGVDKRINLSVKLINSTGKKEFVTRCELLEFALNLLKKEMRGR